MSRSFLIVLIWIGAKALTGQVYFTKNGIISFESSTPIEKIEATNSKAVSVIDFGNDKIEFSVLIKSFHFENALMQTHFNENYLLSDKYPKAVFKCTNAGLSTIDLAADEMYNIPLDGVLTVKGTDKHIHTNVKITVSEGLIVGEASFIVSPSDFKIEIPKLVRDNIAKEILVQVQAHYEPYNK